MSNHANPIRTLIEHREKAIALLASYGLADVRLVASDVQRGDGVAEIVVTVGSSTTLIDVLNAEEALGDLLSYRVLVVPQTSERGQAVSGTARAL